MTKTILIVDDEIDIRLSLGGILRDEGFQVREAETGPQALEKVEEYHPDLVLMDIWMEGYEQGLEALEKLNEDYPDLPVVTISGHGNVETAVKATKMGAFDFIEKPLSYDKILLTVNHALEHQRLTEENTLLRTKAAKRFSLTGKSPAIRDLMETIERAAPTNAWVLITGENGTGKELIAHTIHRLSRRSDRSLIEVNCAAIPEELIESELFGHEKGAFTGANTRRRGKFDLANNSTLFLDEIGDMSLKTQAKILRILQEQKFERIGGVKTIQVDVRVIAATNKNLETEIEKGAFRKDLYYRLNVIPIKAPALRERKEDIPLLTDVFLEEFCRENNTELKQLSSEALTTLTSWDWPGNVRELKNLIERLVIMTPGKLIESADMLLGPASSAHGQAPPGPESYSGQSFREAKNAFERDFIKLRLAEHGGNVTQTAESLDMDRTSLHKKMRNLGLISAKDAP